MMDDLNWCKLDAMRVKKWKIMKLIWEMQIVVE